VARCSGGCSQVSSHPTTSLWPGIAADAHRSAHTQLHHCDQVHLRLLEGQLTLRYITVARCSNGCSQVSSHPATSLWPGAARRLLTGQLTHRYITVARCSGGCSQVSSHPATSLWPGAAAAAHRSAHIQLHNCDQVQRRLLTGQLTSSYITVTRCSGGCSQVSSQCTLIATSLLSGAVADQFTGRCCFC
jgi:hypothetical protein